MTMTAPNPATLPDLSSAYPLTPQQTAAYRKDGHILLRGVCSPAEIAAYEPAIVAAADRFNTETRPLAERDTYGKAFLQIGSLWVKDEAVRRFSLARRFGKIAADLMDVSGVRMYHDQALFKEPGGGLTPWHQDQGYWPFDTDKTITLWMPLVDIPAEVGSMTFASGSNALGYIGELPISDKSEVEISKFVAERGFPKTSYGAMTAGDATFHAGWTLHGAPGNPTPNMREVMTIIYFADGERVAAPKNPNQENDRRNWLMGIEPGLPAASDLNPVVYSRE